MILLVITVKKYDKFYHFVNHADFPFVRATINKETRIVIVNEFVYLSIFLLLIFFFFYHFLHFVKSIVPETATFDSDIRHFNRHRLPYYSVRSVSAATEGGGRTTLQALPVDWKNA